MDPKLKKENPHDGHRSRMKSRFLRAGTGAFEQHQLLELLLFYSVPRANTNEIAHNLLEKFGSFAAVFEAPYRELLKVHGIGPQSATLIKLVIGLFQEYIKDRDNFGRIMDSIDKIGRYFVALFLGSIEEEVYLMCLDNKHKLLDCSKIAGGTALASEISVRKIIESAIRVNAGSLVIAHNHPIGLALPSNEDIEATRRLIESLKLVGVTLFDHIIVANNDFVSLRQSGVFHF